MFITANLCSSLSEMVPWSVIKLVSTVSQSKYKSCLEVSSLDKLVINPLYITHPGCKLLPPSTISNPVNCRKGSIEHSVSFKHNTPFVIVYPITGISKWSCLAGAIVNVSISPTCILSSYSVTASNSSGLVDTIFSISDVASVEYPPPRLIIHIVVSGMCPIITAYWVCWL